MSGRARAYLMTRGTPRRLDYAFLGDAPPQPWWEAVAPWQLAEDAELVVRRTAGRTAVMLSGIPSGRTDVVGTAIRHTVVVDDVQDDPGLARWLVRCGLEEDARTGLGRAVDAAFDAELVDSLLSGASQDVAQRILDALREGVAGSGEPAPEDGDLNGSWAGAAGDDTAVRAFRARTRQLVDGGASGYAFTTHLLDSADGARRAAAELREDVAVLLHEGRLGGVERLGKAEGPGPVRDTLAPGVLAALVGAVLLALAVLVWLMT
ncbi:hypothetical protein [Kitasatospora sp. MBT63]|uniref:hypothetical protein n=1 Tax=Kitasatospora sp. MBT63 TaxID=1444768 RepID=UPI000A7E9158|nr:hypothetical protein [Kitasatospora sp. MBT63]